MKTKITILFSLVITFMCAQIPNASFENWTGNDPNGWNDGNSIAPGTTTKSSNAQSGSFSCQLNNFGGLGGYITTGSLSSTIFFALSGSPAALNGWYILNVSGGDELQVAPTVECPSGYNIAAELYGVSTTVYKQFSVCLNYGSGTCTPDSLSISISLYNSTATHTGSYVIVDDLTLGSCINAIPDITDDITLEPSYPNPASDICNIIYSLPVSGKVSVNLNDMNGRVLKELLSNVSQTPGRYKIPVDVSDLSNGVYFYQVTVDGVPHSQKLVVLKNH